MGDHNDRETGARKREERREDQRDDTISQDAAKNRKPAGGMGLTEPQDDVNDKTRHSDNAGTVTGNAGPSGAAKGVNR